mgnify:CR=1 FL=1
MWRTACGKSGANVLTLARSILALSFSKTIYVLAVCVAVELFAFIYGLVPRLEKSLMHMAAKYDAYFPEITIQDGRASIKEKQPYRIENLPDNGLVLVIDTTLSAYDDALKYLKDAHYGAVLTRSAIVNKEGDQIKVVSLKQLPDMVINSSTIAEAIERFSPIVKTWGAAFLAVCLVVSKLLQALALAAIPFFGVRLYGGFLTFEGAFKLAAVCMVVPVSINFLASYSELSIINMFIVYYAVFVATLIIVTRDYICDMRQIA